MIKIENVSDKNSLSIVWSNQKILDFPFYEANGGTLNNITYSKTPSSAHFGIQNLGHYSKKALIKVTVV